tara:strand:- start:196 stop:411 length:216 start_codon:yes stop_codon:yes gene_type:complete
MLICRQCKGTIGDTGGLSKTLYSICVDCGRKYEEEERLLGQVPDDEDVNNNPLSVGFAYKDQKERERDEDT